MNNTYHTHIIRIGNSKGIRIPKHFLSLFKDKVILHHTEEGIIIEPAKEEDVPPRKTWDRLFQEAVDAGQEPEKDLFEGIENDSDKDEWTWD